ncbi:ESX secretion-associated protein EspG [Amycolatopsis sp. VS8301801F10]|uniref:ESX secretion-associated protein EspG n=1 Tax=Amycolatopsis sp. VS8301801F10 TaxID=2652442 RepID=UPI0038FC9F99
MREDVEQTVTLPVEALSAVWDMLDLGEQHPLLRAGRVWVKSGAHRELHDATINLLAQLGLAENAAPSAHLRATLQVLAFAEREYFAWSALRGGIQRTAIVAQREQTAILVSAQDGLVEIRPAAPTRLATTLFDTLPQIPGAPVRSVSVTPASDAAPDPFDETNSHEYLTATLNQPADATHQLYVARRTEGRHLTGGPVLAADVKSGRILTYQTTEGRTELISGTPRAIVKILNDTFAAL